MLHCPLLLHTASILPIPPSTSLKCFQLLKFVLYLSLLPFSAPVFHYGHVLHPNSLHWPLHLRCFSLPEASLYCSIQRQFCFPLPFPVLKYPLLPQFALYCTLLPYTASCCLSLPSTAPYCFKLPSAVSLCTVQPRTAFLQLQLLHNNNYTILSWSFDNVIQGL